MQDQKWKYLVDFEGKWSGLVESVQFVFSSSIPSDIVTLTQPPYLTPGWRKGPRPHQLECIVNYKVQYKPLSRFGCALNRARLYFGSALNRVHYFCLNRTQFRDLGKLITNSPLRTRALRRSSVFD